MVKCVLCQKEIKGRIIITKDNRIFVFGLDEKIPRGLKWKYGFANAEMLIKELEGGGFNE